MKTTLALFAFLAVLGSACARPPSTRVDPALLPSHGPLTVLVFYSPTCHCLATHDARLVTLAQRYQARGVTFLAVDSEMDANAERDAEDARRRGYPFPVISDPGAKLARATQALYATYSVILDPTGRILYRGGIDSDEMHLHEDATPYLADALDDALAGHPVRRPEAKTLGCSLRTW